MQYNRSQCLYSSKEPKNQSSHEVQRRQSVLYQCYNDAKVIATEREFLQSSAVKAQGNYDDGYDAKDDRRDHWVTDPTWKPNSPETLTLLLSWIWTLHRGCLIKDKYK